MVPALRERLGAAAGERVRRDFTAGKMIDRYEALFAELTRPRP
jgi:glycosyltransferase involved in cell wall biosynthesis